MNLVKTGNIFKISWKHDGENIIWFYKLGKIYIQNKYFYNLGESMVTFL